MGATAHESMSCAKCRDVSSVIASLFNISQIIRHPNEHEFIFMMLPRHRSTYAPFSGAHAAVALFVDVHTSYIQLL